MVIVVSQGSNAPPLTSTYSARTHVYYGVVFCHGRSNCIISARKGRHGRASSNSDGFNVILWKDLHEFYNYCFCDGILRLWFYSNFQSFKISIDVASTPTRRPSCSIVLSSDSAEPNSSKIGCELRRIAGYCLPLGIFQRIFALRVYLCAMGL